jgi:hypothetical protein
MGRPDGEEFLGEKWGDEHPDELAIFLVSCALAIIVTLVLVLLCCWWNNLKYRNKKKSLSNVSMTGGAKRDTDGSCAVCYLACGATAAEACCSCCYECCLNEDLKVEKVVKHFTPKRLASARSLEAVGMLQHVVGRCVLAGGQKQALYTPGTSQPCVYYNLVVEEERMIASPGAYGATDLHIEHTVMFKEEHGQDFYLQDEEVKLYIPAGRRDGCFMERQKTKDRFFTVPAIGNGFSPMQLEVTVPAIIPD